MPEPLSITATPGPHLAAHKKPRTKKIAVRPVASKFEFVASDPGGKPDPNARQFIRSYVMRGKNTKRHRDDSQRRTVPRASKSVPKARPSDAPAQIEAVPATEATQSLCHDSVEDIAIQALCLPGIMRVPSDLELFHFATPLDKSSRYLIFRCKPPMYSPPLSNPSDMLGFTTVKESMYPVEWCFQYDPEKVCWFRWLLEDHTYLQSVLFMVSAFQDHIDTVNDNHVGGLRGFSARTQSRFKNTIQLLQEKIQDHETQIEDTTVSVVATLAMVADAAGDAAGFKAHVIGLKEMVRLRGGLGGLNHNRQLQIKLCRVDLGWSMASGSKPEIYNNKLSWEPFFEMALTTNSLPYNRPSPSGIQSVVELWDYRLKNAFTDLQDFAHMANSLIPGHKKLRPELFQEIMLSIQYRLLLLEYPSGIHPLEESIRIGLLSFESTLFLHTPKLGLKLKSERFYCQLHECIERIHVDGPEVADIKLWLLLVGSIIVFQGNETWLVESINELSGDQPWSEVRKRVKRVMWVDIVHDEPGRHAFETAKQGRVV
ncbi:hypothetical protein G7Z17_g12418 [Cylindrodendrum hubeiense]|uniref:Tachykinin family protein n=1 Tax=Cylindrodendrum hubeiense TaxID=595255 RepID=A0A9P5H337_9HYPO|nr:hypothetical protein G7Z17_g12418 [Cylindrodendrum hubeiense]